MNDNELQFDATTEEEVIPAEESPAEEIPATEETVTEAPATEEAPVTEEQLPQEQAPSGLRGFFKKLGKKGIIIGSAAIALVAVIAIVIGLLASTPFDQVSRSFNNSVSALESNESVSLLETIANGGSTQIIVDLSALTQTPSSASLKYYTDAKNEKMALDILLEIDPNQPMDFTLYLDNETLVVTSDWLLGDTAYGAGIAELIHKANSGTEVEIPDNYTESYKQFSKAMDDLVAKLGLQLLASINEHTTFEEEDTTLTFGTKDANVTAISISLDHEQISAILADMIEFLRTDNSFRKFINEYVLYMETFSASSEYSLSLDPDAIAEEIYGALDTAAAEMESVKSLLKLGSTSFEMTFYVTKSGKQLVGMDLQAAAYGEKLSASAYAGPDLENPDEISFYLNDGVDAYRAVYVVKANDDNAFSSQLTMGYDEETVFLGKVDWNKISGDVSITATNENNDTFLITGSLLQTKDQTTIAFNDIGVAGETIDLGTTIILSTKDATPSAPDFTDITTMSDEDLETLLAKVFAIAQSLGLV